MKKGKADSRLRKAESESGQRSFIDRLPEWVPVAFALYALLLMTWVLPREANLLVDWYSLDPQAVTTTQPGVHFRVLALTLIIVGAVASMAFALLRRFVEGVSASLTEVYRPLIGGISIGSSLLVVTIVGLVLDQPVAVRLLLLAAPLIVLATAARWLSVARVRTWNELNSQLFIFAQLLVSKGAEGSPPTFEDDVRKPETLGDKVVAFFIPFALAQFLLLPLGVFVTFGTGLVAVAGLLLNGGELTFDPVLARALFLIATGLIVLLVLPGFVRVIRRTKAPLLFVVLATGMLVIAGAIVSIGGYVLLGSAAAVGPLVAGSGYFLLALPIASAEVLLALLRWSNLRQLMTTIRNDLRTRKFWIDNYVILRRFPQPRDPKGYVFFHSQTDTYTIASLLLVLCRLRQLGWATVVVDRWPIPQQRTGSKHVDCFVAVKLGRQRTLNFDWHIDWEAGKVEAAGMNFYHPIWEGLSRHFGRYRIRLSDKYDVELKDESVERVFLDILTVADSTLLICFRILNTVAGQGKPVRILGSSGQFVPNAVWNIFCREIGKDRDMHFVWAQQGYQTYYKDGARLSDRISLQNMTRKWPYSNPYLPHKEDFDAWVARGQNVEEIVEEAVGWARTMRATSVESMSSGARSAFERIRTHREGGGPVVCVLGKMVFDLSTPWERGPAHSGMADWINHTVEIAERNPSVLYVVKPHPYESRPEIAGVVEQFFADLIERPVPQNVLILAHDWFNLYTLFPYIDLGVLWNGTSGLELGLHGIPCIMCSDWGPVDYPIGLPAPKNRADYERMLSEPRSVALPDDFKQRCALLLKYTASDEVMIPYGYCARPLTNEPFGPPYWYMDKVRQFIQHGDPHIDAACQRFL